MVCKKAFCAVLALTVLDMAMGELGGAAGPLSATLAEAQQMGRDPWAFPQGNPTFSAQSQLLRRQQASASSSSDGGGGGGGGDAYVTNNVTTNNSTSIGNWNEIQQTLGQGATATIDLRARQNNQGNIRSSSGGMVSSQGASSQQASQTTSQAGPLGGQATIQNGNP